MASHPQSWSLLPTKDAPVIGTSVVNPSLDIAVDLAGYREASLGVNWRPKGCGVNLGGFEEKEEDKASRGGTPPPIKSHQTPQAFHILLEKRL